MTDTIHRDFLGQEIKEGDRIISHFSGGYAGLRWGTVVGFTPKMVRVEFKGQPPMPRYARDLVVMSEEQQHHLTMKILKQ